MAPAIEATLMAIHLLAPGPKKRKILSRSVSGYRSGYEKPAQFPAGDARDRDR